MLEKKDQEIITKNLNEVSFYFFFIIAFTHILSGLLFTNEYLKNTTWLINRLLDIPFIWITLIYLYSNIKLHLLKNNMFSHSYDLVILTTFTIIGITTFLADLVFSNQLP